jgi:CDP-diacylglycerol--glycerol-3-phosphate 3-phosphatidyltransferase
MAAFTSSYVADQFDGYLARRAGTQSAFGEALDMELDGLGILLAVSLAVSYGTLPVIFLPIGLARYGFSFLIALRERAGLPVADLPSSRSRRPIAGLTRGFVSAALWPALDRPEATLAGIPFFLAIGASFLRDSLVVACVLDPKSPRYQRTRALLRRVLLDLIPILLRLSLPVFTLGVAPGLIAVREPLNRSFSDAGLTPAPLWTTVFGATMLLLTILIVIGLAARLAATLFIFPLGLTIASVGLDPWRALLFVNVIAILLLGSGVGSLWKPGDRLLERLGVEVPRSENGAGY